MARHTTVKVSKSVNPSGDEYTYTAELLETDSAGDVKVLDSSTGTADTASYAKVRGTAVANFMAADWANVPSA